MTFPIINGTRYAAIHGSQVFSLERFVVEKPVHIEVVDREAAPDLIALGRKPVAAT